jgi:hypothetical protein
MLEGNLAPAKAVDPTLAATTGQAIPLEGLRGLERQVAHIYNQKGAYIEAQAKALGCGVDLVVALLTLESGGRAFNNDGSLVIRFENHVFRRQLGATRHDAYRTHFADKGPAAHHYRTTEDGEWRSVHGGGQAREHEVLELAKTIDERAALAAISMGAGQTMGFNHSVVGHDSPQTMYAAYDSGIRPQLDGIFDYLRNVPGALKAARDRDFTGVARAYNGKGYAKHGYHTKLRRAADAFLRARRSQVAPTRAPLPTPRARVAP